MHLADVHTLHSAQQVARSIGTAARSKILTRYPIEFVNPVIW